MKSKTNLLGACALFSLVLTLTGARAFAESGPKYGPQATRLYHQHEFILKNKAPDYWAMSPYYVPQRDPGACILASFTMTLNALRAADALTASDGLVTQESLFKAIKDEPPAKRFYVDHGKTVVLSEMPALFAKAAKDLIHKSFKIEAIYADNEDKATVDKIEKVLIENEKSANSMVVANFLQSEYTGDPEGKVGHAAPVAAYDAKRKSVLIFDPDREYYEPYWVSLTTFVKGLNTIDKDAGKNRGILWIHE